MSPRRKVATKTRPVKRNQILGIQKTTKPARSTRTTRAVRSLKPAIVNPTTRRSTRLSSKSLQAQADSVPPELQQPSIAFRNPNKPPSPTRRKRQRKPEDECSPEDEFSPKRRRRVESVRELSKTNLEEHNRQTKSETSMGRGKRTLSRRTSTADMSQDAASVSSQKSSTYANYRWINLDSARIFAENRPVPQNIQNRVDAIIQPTLSEQKEKELSTISNTFCNDFVDVLKGASREDDSIEPIHTALTSLDSGKKFLFPRKSDWDATLKPAVQPSVWQFNVADMPIDPADDSPNPLNKRQQAALSYISPERSESTMPPSCENSGPPMPPPPAPNISMVKTPRPDITIGLRDTTVVEKLKANGLRTLQANDFLKALQNQQILCSNPLQPAYPMRFPPLVVEGKSYLTGRPVFEAQNQAAVSGSCMTNLQHKLAELSKRMSPGSYQDEEPLAFSICTEGPMM
ncbi:MAG: hypothetical protein LQ349_000924 [Xanthoria aureola]|nr:MAG: hypothetical protein LQ349_000924 [Xanthoria aureola]